MKLTFLGTGSTFPSLNRQSTSLLIEVGPKLLLVNCTGEPSQSILLNKHSLTSLTDVILTNAQVEHLYALPSLLQSLWFSRYSEHGQTLTIHGYKQTLEQAVKLVDMFSLRTRSGPYPKLQVHFHVLQGEGQLIIHENVTDWNVIAFPVHLGTEIGLGITLEHTRDRKRIIYSGDALADELMRAQITPRTNVIIHDCSGMKSTMGHAGAEDIRKLMLGSPATLLYLVHVPPLADTQLQEMVRCIASSYTGTITIPEDNYTLAVPDHM